ncbi:hypothetical protein LNQ52_27870 [Klebsiella pneumoniae subsp. pneumoniae]|nr:hypothetical protein [Klebsiella pneumoniae subsp. pneumoniae]
MESASLTYDQRLLAVQQLGRDYMAAGLCDRAEDMFKQLVDETDFRLGALQQLLQIYQATSDWQSAIEVAERLVKLGKEKTSWRNRQLLVRTGPAADGSQRSG